MNQEYTVAERLTNGVVGSEMGRRTRGLVERAIGARAMAEPEQDEMAAIYDKLTKYYDVSLIRNCCFIYTFFSNTKVVAVAVEV